MKSKLIHNAQQKTYALVFETGDECVTLMEQFAREHRLSAAQITGIGAFQQVTLGYFDWEQKSYLENKIDEQVEVVSLIGDVAEKGGEAKVHAHVVVARRDGTAYGGHLLGATIRPTLEVIVTESPSYLAKKMDPVSGLALINIDK
ncbi:PPC domain-containing DNA-binding protein [Novipirellula rosea]|uniref:DNA-binding protein n=1 Tax=Novipirellula rosea TaxID=1031540 RepID=A0ABP8NMG2_9BACT